MSAQDLDTLKLGEYLAEHIPGFSGPLTAEKFAGGQSNPTFKLSAGGVDYVLRRKPPGELLKSAHAVDREFRVISALRDTEVPVPRTFTLCEDESVIGSMFYVMEYLEGRILWDPSLPDARDKAERAAIFDSMNATMAALHNVDVDAVGLSDYGRPGNYFERQLSRWTKQYRASETKTIAAMEKLLDYLPANMPEDDGRVSLVHGDYRIDNLMFEQDGTRCVGVLDWELSTIGHPYADLAAVIMQWQMPPGKEGRGLAGLDRESLGLPSDQAFIDAYCSKRGLAGIDNFGFYLGFTFFRMAGILQGVYKRALDGNASDPARAKKFGSYVPMFAQHGLAALRSTV